ncbi:uncharacterized protein LTR77_005444 [Saxophila tyrrhenica]|uniref:F-box domain-containing protein n=1 Tax=Saxophila tyrrhenica TaxID=1690608 RepID=A0AAV9P8Z6_9PEZI|nr:hypothetical protein LTR77_005444 [Saxophila tyrrhenica]
MADGFVQSFAAIPTAEGRQKALHQLVQSLEYGDRQAACAFIHAKNDILPRLPLELALGIFDHLNLFDAWRLQLVNRRWRNLLSSERFMRATLARWESHDPNDSARGPDEVARESIRDKIRHMRALLDGKPYTYTTFRDTGVADPEHPPRQPHCVMDLKGDKLAYISSKPEDGDTVIIRNLITGAASMLRSDGRDQIMTIALTTKAVALVTYTGCMYVTEFSDHLFLKETRRVQLPSSRIQAVSGHDKTFVLAMGPNGSAGDVHEASVLVYDAELNHLQGFAVKTSRPPQDKELDAKLVLCSRGLIVDSNQKTIDLFTLASDCLDAVRDKYEISCLVIMHHRVSFTGSLIDGKQGRAWFHRLTPKVYSRERAFIMFPPQPSGNKNEYLLRIGEKRMTSRVDSLRLRAGVAFDRQGVTWPLRDNVRRQRSLWNLTLDRPVRGQAGTAEKFHAEWKGLTIDGITNLERHEVAAVMNDTFLANLQVSESETQATRLQVFCFDENVYMYGAQDFGSGDF